MAEKNKKDDAVTAAQERLVRLFELRKDAKETLGALAETAVGTGQKLKEAGFEVSPKALHLATLGPEESGTGKDMFAQVVSLARSGARDYWFTLIYSSSRAVEEKTVTIQTNFRPMVMDSQRPVQATRLTSETFKLEDLQKAKDYIVKSVSDLAANLTHSEDPETDPREHRKLKKLFQNTPG